MTVLVNYFFGCFQFDIGVVMGFLRFLQFLFVLIPLYAVQSVCGAIAYTGIFGLYMGDNENAIWMLIGGIIGVLITISITNIIRYEEIPSIILWLLEFVLSPLSIIFMAITFILVILSWFTDVSVDSKYVPDISSTGFWPAFLLHFFMYSGALSAGWDRMDKKRKKAEASDDPAVYKWQNVRHQLLIWFFTLLHSVFVLFFVPLGGIDIVTEVFFDNDWDVYKLLYENQLIVFIICILIYLVFAFLTAGMKGVDGMGRYYEDTEITEVSYHWRSHINNWEEKREVVQEAGWKVFLKPGMIIYWLFGAVMFIPQTIALIIAIVTPPNSSILPCRIYDINPNHLSFKDRFLHFLFGFVTEW